jgi:hypothetical protein
LDRVKDQPRWGVVNRIMMQMPADMSEDDKLATYYKLNMFHEIGHVVDTETDNVLSQRVAQTVMQKVSADKVEGWLDKNISTYATTSAKECLGELVCMMLAGLKTPPEFDFIKATLKKFGQ